ncbi:hypothetical protein [Rummeliibacillus sp. POC4]|uniref:hypothetical protein n=1 Tax=Rummeliibacillus sp. POC4 TaxID=2305899 RepID=UPI000E66B3BB|nr:hypothetical protein [Rummeliibacillus sp. POC4]RIJ63127.1 hypothetical protein D1606_16630 [Rummeliibacillus sp. POC4]
MNKLSFREQDVDAAIKEHNCIDTLNVQMMIHARRQEYKEARELLKDIDKSLKELENFRQRKVEYDRFLEVIKKLNKLGIPAEEVTRCVN